MPLGRGLLRPHPGAAQPLAHRDRPRFWASSVSPFSAVLIAANFPLLVSDVDAEGNPAWGPDQHHPRRSRGHRPGDRARAGRDHAREGAPRRTPRSCADSTRTPDPRHTRPAPEGWTSSAPPALPRPLIGISGRRLRGAAIGAPHGFADAPLEAYLSEYSTSVLPRRRAAGAPADGCRAGRARRAPRRRRDRGR